MTSRWLQACAAVLLASAGTAHAQSATPYLDAADRLGDWLIDATQDGRRWPNAIGTDGAVRPGATLGLDAGAAGVGLFFLSLHDHTRDPRHWAIAIAAADHEHSMHVRGTYNGPDYLAGAAGSGLFLMALHARSGDPQHLQWARDASDYLDRTALRPAPGQRHWLHFPGNPRVYTGIPHGAAGIALLDVALHQRTGDAVYLDRAEEAYAWVRTHALPLGGNGAIGFKRLTMDTDVYNWWSGGSAGIMLLQNRLYGLTGDARYLDDLRRTADGLVQTGAAGSPAGRVWTTDSSNGTYHPIVYSHGNASIAPALLLAHAHFDDPVHASTANASLAWLIANARSGSDVGADGVYWVHSLNSTFPNMRSNGGFTGTASVGWMLARTYALTRDPQLRDVALQAADYLIDVGEPTPSGGLRWINYFGAENTAFAEQGYTLGWYIGNASIGMFLIAAHELATGQRPRGEVDLP